MKTKEFIMASFDQIKEYDFKVVDGRTFTTLYLHDVCAMMQTYADQETAELKKEITRLHDINQQFEAENQRIRNEGVEQIRRLKSELFKAKGNKGVPGE